MKYGTVEEKPLPNGRSGCFAVLLLVGRWIHVSKLQTRNSGHAFGSSQLALQDPELNAETSYGMPSTRASAQTFCPLGEGERPTRHVAGDGFHAVAGETAVHGRRETLCLVAAPTQTSHRGLGPVSNLYGLHRHVGPWGPLGQRQG